MMITLEQFRIFFPEFASQKDEVIQIFIDLANEIICDDACYKFAKLYRAAHEIIMHLRASDIESEISEITGKSNISAASADGLSVSYAKSAWANNPQNEIFSLTSYGLKYLQAIEECKLFGYAVNVC